MGSVEQSRQADPNMESEDNLIMQVESYDEKFEGDETQDRHRRESESEPEPEERKDGTEASEQEPESTDGASTDEQTVEIDGERVPLSQVVEWKHGYMKDADYRKKTAMLAEQKRKLEAVYGRPEDKKAVEDVPPVPDGQEFNPYDINHMTSLVKNAVGTQFQQARQQEQEVNQKRSYEQVRTETWESLTKEHPDLLDKESTLFKTADAIINADPGLERSPLCDSYAVSAALRILSPVDKARAKTEGAKEMARKISKQPTSLGKPAGGGDSDEPESLSADEVNLINRADRNPTAVINFSDADMKKYEAARRKLASGRAVV